MAVALGVLMIALSAAVVPLALLAHQLTLSGSIGPAFLLLPFAAVGVLVAHRQPRNPIGWILLGLALRFMLSIDSGLYSVIAYRLGHPGLPLARLGRGATQSWVGLIILLPLPILLFPDGRLPSPRWRWTLWGLRGCSSRTLVAGSVSRTLPPSPTGASGSIRRDELQSHPLRRSPRGPSRCALRRHRPRLGRRKAPDYRRSTGERRSS